MLDIVTFVPRVQLDAEVNLAAFIELCRTKLKVFGAALNFSEDVWDVSDSIETKGKYGAVRIVFSTHATAGCKAPIIMAEPFCSFAKAYVRYQQGMRPTMAVSQRIASLRLLDAALSEIGDSNSPTRIDSHVLNRAAQKAKEHFMEATAYRLGSQLEMVSDFLRDNRLRVSTARWRNPIKRPRDGVRVGAQFDQRRAEMMPSESALDALPKVFLLASEPADKLVSSITAILCSAPDRISEVLLLPVNCEVKKTGTDNGGDVYGLRWWPAKGAEPMVKWVVPSMTEVVIAAITNIRAATDEARLVARWYENHPEELYLPGHLEHLRQQDWLSMPEVGDVLFAGPSD